MTEDLGPCEEWTGSRHKCGYGRRHRNKKVVLVHRDAWEQANGPIPAGLFVMHLCNNPPCYRLSHLKLGTHKENMEHMVQCGRWTPRPARGGLPPLAPEVIGKIVEATGSNRSIAERFGTTHKTVAKYKRRATA